MVKINNLYLDRFKLSHNEYLYPIKRGIYLAFEKVTHEYIGIELFYYIDPVTSSKLEYNKISELLCMNVLEIVD